MDLKGKIDLYISYTMNDSNILFDIVIKHESELLEFMNRIEKDHLVIIEIINNLGY